MTKPAPTTAERICATSRDRPGPIRRNSATVIAIATAAAERPIGMTTPKAANQRGPPPITRTSTNGVDNNSAMAVTWSAIAAIRTEKIFANFTGEDMIRSRSARA
jgi:hypothetical protein